MDTAQVALKGLKDKLEAHPEQVDSNRMGMLKLLNFGYNQYAGSVPVETVKKRRAKNKDARKSRRINSVRGK